MISTIDIIALEWFDKVNGNSYFAATVTIDYGTGTQKQFILPFQYGYGDHYRDIAARELVRQGVINIPDRTPLWRFCEENKIILRTTKHTNCKKSELINL